MDRKPKIYPPVYFIIFIVGELLFDRYLPVIRLSSLPVIGITVSLIGVYIGIWSIIIFRRKKTTQMPFEESAELVVEGPFRVTRNPMYAGFTLILLGVAICLGSLTAFVFPIAMYYFMDTKIIPLEEKMLENTFKEKYIKYKKSVRRWI